MPTSSYRSAITSLSIVTCAACIYAGEVPDADVREAQTLFEQALDHGRSWQHGIVEITMMQTKPERVTRREFYAFDHERGLMRFDCREEGPRGGAWNCKHIVTPRDIFLLTGSPDQPSTLSRHSPGKPPKVSTAFPFAPKALAVASATDVVNRRDHERLRQFYTERYPFRPERVIAFRRDGSKIEATWEVPARLAGTRDLRRTFLFDGDSCGLPSRISAELRNPETGDWDPTGTTTITWQPIGDTWVPIRWSSEDVYGQIANVVDIELDWTSINEPVPANLFDRDDLKLDSFTYLIDGTGDVPIIEGAAR